MISLFIISLIISLVYSFLFFSRLFFKYLLCSWNLFIIFLERFFTIYRIWVPLACLALWRAYLSSVLRVIYIFFRLHHILRKYFINIYITLLIHCKFNCCSHQLAIYQINSQKLLRMSLNSRNKFKNSILTLKLCNLSAHCSVVSEAEKAGFQQSKPYFCSYPVHGYWFW